MNNDVNREEQIGQPMKCAQQTGPTLFVAVFLLGTIVVHAQEEWHRKGTWEIYGSGQYLFGNTVDFSKFGARLKVDDTAMFGLGAGYHITDHWAVSLDLLGGFTSFNSSGMQLALNNDAFVLSANLNAEYNFLRGRFSPLLRAGLGLYDITDNAGYWSTYGETDLSWNVGGGLRWNLSDHFVLKLIGGASWTNLKDSSSTAEFGFVTLGIGATF